VELRGGRRVILRPMQPDEPERLLEAFERLSADSRYRRFFRPMAKISERELAYLSAIDHHDHEAILALDPQRDETVGVARFVRTDPASASAEAAVAVVDDWQGEGLGKALLERLSERAREEGVERFTALVQADNRRAIGMLGGLGPTTTTHSDELVELDIELGDVGVSSGLAAALAAAAASRLGTRPLAQRILGKARELYLGRTKPVASGYTLDSPIVVGTDGSAGAGSAVRRAAELAAALGTTLHVVHAYRDWTERLLRTARLDPEQIAGQQLDARPKARALVADASAALADLAIELEPHTVRGDPADALLSVAEVVGAQLVVVGSKGTRAASRSDLGSVAAKLAAAASCNVLIVRRSP